MKKGTVWKMLGENRYALYREGLVRLIDHLNKESAIDGNRFTLKDIMTRIELPFMEEKYILFCYENIGRQHLLSLFREGVLKCDKSNVPYTYFRTSDCMPNPRIHIDIDVNAIFKQDAPGIRSKAERDVIEAKEGTRFRIKDFMHVLHIPYLNVPVARRKYLSLMINIFVKLSKEGYLSKKSEDSIVIYERTKVAYSRSSNISS